MIKLDMEIEDGTLTYDAEVYGKGTALAAITRNVIYKITDSKEEFEAVAMCLAVSLNNTDYEAIKEAFSDELQR